MLHDAGGALIAWRVFRNFGLATCATAHCWLVSLARHVHDSTLARQGSLRVATKPHGVGDRRPTGYGGRGLVQCDFVGLVWVPRRF